MIETKVKLTQTSNRGFKVEVDGQDVTKYVYDVVFHADGQGLPTVKLGMWGGSQFPEEMRAHVVVKLDSFTSEVIHTLGNKMWLDGLSQRDWNRIKHIVPILNEQNERRERLTPDK